MSEAVHSTSDLAIVDYGEVAVFDPSQFRTNQAKADAVIDYAKDIRDWPLLAKAIDFKLDQQAAYVSGYKRTITPDHGAGRGHKKVRDRGPFTEVSKQQISRWEHLLLDRVQWKENQIRAAKKKAELEDAENHRAEGTGDNEWYTPAIYIEGAKAVMGGIDVDPATSIIAQQTVQATSYYTREDDGLKHEWRGRVWLNPPYARGVIPLFIEKLLQEYMATRTSEAILLTHSYTDTSWFQVAACNAAVMCFTAGRIRFTDADGKECSPTQGQAFMYLGRNREKFAHVFGQWGFVVRAA